MRSALKRKYARDCYYYYNNNHHHQYHHWYCDWTTGWTIRGLNPSRSKRSFPLETSRRSLGPTEPPIQWVPAFFVWGEAVGA